MFKKNWPFILAGVVVISLALFFYYLYSKSPTLNWNQNYNYSSSSPYGNELLYKLMKNLYAEKDFIKIEEPLTYNRNFNAAGGTNNVYFYSGYSFFPDKSTVSSLCNFISKGNQVFIATNEVSQYFIDSILRPETTKDKSSTNSLSQIQCIQYHVGLVHPDFKLSKKPFIRFKVFQANIPMQAGYFSEDFIEKQSLNNAEHEYCRIGYLEVNRSESFTNYIKIKVGDGWLHLYSSPLVFTNYYLRKPEVFQYAQNVFLHLVPGNIYWHVNTYASEEVSENEVTNKESPFEVLLSFSAFRYAWYSFFGGTILFCLFSFKRKQRAIPVIESHKNTSIEFAETITKLYLAEGNYKNIAEQKFRYFFNYVRTKFGINIKNDLLNDKSRLAYLSQVPIGNIDKIIFNYKKLQALANTTAEELNESVILINEFYRNSR